MELDRSLRDRKRWEHMLYVIPICIFELNGFVIRICVSIVRHDASSSVSDQLYQVYYRIILMDYRTIDESIKTFHDLDAGLFTRP